MRRVGFGEVVKKKKVDMMTDPGEWERKFGTAPPTEIQEVGYRDLVDLQQPFQCVSSTLLSRSPGTDK